MKKYIDLTHCITHQMPVFPADPAVGVLTHHNYQNGYFVSQVIFGTHTGTHIDVPVHKIKGGKTVDEVPVERFVKTAYVMDLKFLKPLEEITRSHLDKYAEKVKGISAVILKTGWGSHFGKEDFFTSFPGISEEAVEWFKEHGINLIGLESPSVNAIKHAEIHTLLLQNDIYVVESLANAEEITAEYVELYAVPLKFKGLDGSPVRAFAIEE
ncbi:MAG: cyclase family protein [Burkholderiales bacterium]